MKKTKTKLYEGHNKTVMILVCIVLVSSAIVGLSVWYFMNQEIRALRQEHSLQTVRLAYDEYCKLGGKVSESEFVAFVKDQPEISDAKVENMDGKRMMTFGWAPVGGMWNTSNWSSESSPLDCSGTVK